MISINLYLNNILEDFNDYLNERKKLCGLASVSFDQGRLPDYNDIHVQQYYLLRYAYAYAFEYKEMYHRLFDRFTPKKSITVTSIGCGTMLDYWALARVLNKREIKDVVVNYTGIDQVDWNYLMPGRKKDSVNFVLNDVLDEMEDLDELDGDVYFFPKSISEFRGDGFKRLCRIFEKTPIQKDRFHLLISVRSNEATRSSDLNKADALCKAILKNGFQTNDDCQRFWSAIDPEKKIRASDADFDHPQAVVELLRELPTKCTEQKNSKDCEDCKERLDRWPILTQKQLCFLILSFKRA